MSNSKEDKKWKKDYNEWMSSNQAQLEELAAMEDFLDSFLNSGKENEKDNFEDDLEAQLAMFDPIKQLNRGKKK